MLLVGVMTALGLLGWSEGLWVSTAVAVGFFPSGWLAPGGWRRRAAEAFLLPIAAMEILVSSAVIRQMMVAPMIVLALWAAWSSAVHQVRNPSIRIVLTACLGAAVRMCVGFSSISGGWVGVVGAIASSAVIPGFLVMLSPSMGLVGALLMLPVTLIVSSGAAWAMVTSSFVIAAVSRVFLGSRIRETIRECSNSLSGWYPGLGAVALVVSALGAWGLPGLWDVLPGVTWVSGIIIAVILAISLRLPPATAGACSVLACLVIGAPIGSTPEGGAVRLDRQTQEAGLKVGDGSPYVVDVVVKGLDQLTEGDTIAMLRVGPKKIWLKMERGPEGAPFVGHSNPDSYAPEPSKSIWRPAGGGRSGWQRADRIVFKVPDGVEPVIARHSKLPDEIGVRLAASGPSRPTSPRDLEAERWLWLTAAMVALLQLVSGLWWRRGSWLPWMLLTAGLILSRVSVEPLHLIIGRHAVDLCLAALLLAWVPSAVAWIKQGRVFLAVGLLLAPLAAATPHLTPSLWGDEPYHVALMESALEDHDLNLANNLMGGGAVRETILSSNRLFHSPVLAGLLLPGFLIAGRGGALVLLALAGAGLVALVIRRYRELRAPPDRAVVVVVMIACLTYPLVTFSTQIWPGLLGGLLVAAMLLLIHRGRRSRAFAAVLTLVAVAAKTRLALVALPVALAGWWRGNPRTRLIGAAVIGVAAAGALLFGWWTMGHPFGFYRRIHHLLPNDPVLAVTVIGGLLFDVAGGLAWTAPLWLVALVAVPLLWRRGGDGERALLLGGGATLAALLSSIEWYGGGSPPARYLVPLLPAVLLALGMVVSRPDGSRRVIALVFPAAFVSWWVLVTRPHFSVNPGDGGWWLTKSLSRRFAADARALFPSFLTPGTATWIVPLVLIGLGGAIWWMCRRPRRAWWLARVGPAVWLVAALALVTALDLRADTVVEAESAQVRRHGGDPAPPRGTPTRFSYPNGWLLGEGDALTFPINLKDDRRVFVEARIRPPGWAGILAVGWDGEVSQEVRVRRGPKEGRIAVPDPPGSGRRRLILKWSGRDRAVLFVDRVVVTRD